MESRFRRHSCQLRRIIIMASWSIIYNYIHLCVYVYIQMYVCVYIEYISGIYIGPYSIVVNPRLGVSQSVRFWGGVLWGSRSLHDVIKTCA